jgi:hypothetical protein
MKLKDIREYILCEIIWLFDRAGNIIDRVENHSSTEYDEYKVISIDASDDEIEIVIE